MVNIHSMSSQQDTAPVRRGEKMKDTVKDIINRRSVKQFKAEQISDDELMQVLEA